MKEGRKVGFLDFWISMYCIILALEGQQPLVKIQNFTNCSAAHLLEFAVFVVLTAELEVFCVTSSPELAKFPKTVSLPPDKHL